ncbi:MAG: SufD family Fe-S cluster assembly protein [Candidatus Ancillula sp.]|nr:SufD family Fe-S cluster assembly protein [Candidatus Ancillula sp.]
MLDKILNQSAKKHYVLGENQVLDLLVVQMHDADCEVDIKVDLEGIGSNVNIFGIYFASAGQIIQNRVVVNHIAPKCTSSILYKGALLGSGAKTSWDGFVNIGENAVNTDTYETNRNLLLSEGASAVSVPNLEILTGDIVRAGHASATGRFDDQQLFYLMSRGIDAKTAQKLIVRGFFEEIIQNAELDDLEQTEIFKQLERKIDEVR